MYRLLDCITQEHIYGLVAVAAFICVIGSVLSTHMSTRLTQWTGMRRLVQLPLAGLITGATIWSTHFIAMLSYDPGYAHGYEPVLTGVSLLVGVIGSLAANTGLAYARSRIAACAAGAVFGLTVTAMHYTGMNAYLLPGTIVWSLPHLVASVLLGAGFGALSYGLIVQRLGGVAGRLWPAAAMVLAICLMHFTGMSAIEIRLDSSIEVPTETISDTAMAMLIFGVTGIILLIAIASASIEVNLEGESRSQLTHAALHDPLTGMPNRMWLTRKLDALQTQLTENETAKAAVLTIDLNLFKEVNDLHGHAIGDAVLRRVSQSLNEQKSEGEYIARVGGDEFVAIKLGFRRIEEVQSFAERLHAAIVEPIDLEEVSLRVGASIGIASTLEDGRDPNQLLHKSDVAMYRAKSEADTPICLFDEEMDRRSRDRTQLVHDLRQALQRDEFELVYQLQNTLETLAPVGFEVLLRWNHPTRGRVSPDEFIPVAEETGLVRDIGAWVLREACREAAQWDHPYSIAVNVAPQQLVQPSFVEDVMDNLFETGLDPQRLELEITEASIIDDQAHTLKVMHKLKELSIRIAMDDFGTGYSSLSMLQTFPFDKIKIDRSFVQDVHKDAQRAAIVRSTLLLGAALDIPVLAEGVEVEDELSFLRAESCTSVQGFYFGHPMTRDDMRRIACNAAVDGEKNAA
ncbi:putative bifunctional diguanylate cyclase/phosphodiesterase [Phaeobacter gallaeciensis]|uniref:putative bifunctional diguanylate cyclase/phosphodiesterase n=1 Tax=Phaeobacter gallaeciensis TaxID=60890 RepID=UPI00237F20D7|nr:bifunctional diguanylate cyclase/phosphodiesterase [Phaeobacter gallaeciensis]MDE4098556.1 bifunctional diguanylate cyclase/phosphodiesterase [Phaeobacter gallaeciensis]MDE4107366.1 bifunctional diguanylate cyclase/phosphodiesterase [Phaeobacter gallaeciensis]MDE4111682.1 bifunctional diguanylate cyclase/phosphodiesterase [Phaeobacter gallaeciensis]MDE4116291.1 bifunctional diguanylate cyclase/phosphodiesterase [Phaeobacter gallaeciensis]MDE4120762.1 bifunctional diguanylate cyclase/phospho